MKPRWPTSFALGLALYLCAPFSEESAAIPLFKAEKDGRTNYILGTFHAPMAADDVPHILREIVTQSKTVIVEMEVNQKQREEISMGWFLEGYDQRRDNKKLMDVFTWSKLSKILFSVNQHPSNFRNLNTPQAFGYIESILKQADQKISGYGRLKAEIDLHTGLSAQQREQRTQQIESLRTWASLPKKSIDDYVLSLAREHKIEIVSMDKIAPVMIYAKTVNDNLLRKYIRSGIQALTELENRYAEYYRSGTWIEETGPKITRRYLQWRPTDEDISPPPAVFRIIHNLPEASGLRTFEVNRHQNWLQSILTNFNEGKTLLAVGIGHLVRLPVQLEAYQGITILEGLEQNGYEVTFIGDLDDCAPLLKSKSP